MSYGYSNTGHSNRAGHDSQESHGADDTWNYTAFAANPVFIQLINSNVLHAVFPGFYDHSEEIQHSSVSSLSEASDDPIPNTCHDLEHHDNAQPDVRPNSNHNLRLVYESGALSACEITTQPAFDPAYQFDFETLAQSSPEPDVQQNVEPAPESAFEPPAQAPIESAVQSVVEHASPSATHSSSQPILERGSVSGLRPVTHPSSQPSDQSSCQPTPESSPSPSAAAQMLSSDEVDDGTKRHVLANFGDEALNKLYDYAKSKGKQSLKSSAEVVQDSNLDAPESSTQDIPTNLSHGLKLAPQDEEFKPMTELLHASVRRSKQNSQQMQSRSSLAEPSQSQQQRYSLTQHQQSMSQQNMSLEQHLHGQQNSQDDHHQPNVHEQREAQVEQPQIQQPCNQRACVKQTRSLQSHNLSRHARKYRDQSPFTQSAYSKSPCSPQFCSLQSYTHSPYDQQPGNCHLRAQQQYVQQPTDPHTYAPQTNNQQRAARQAQRQQSIGSQLQQALLEQFNFQENSSRRQRSHVQQTRAKKNKAHQSLSPRAKQSQTQQPQAQLCQVQQPIGQQQIRLSSQQQQSPQQIHLQDQLKAQYKGRREDKLKARQKSSPESQQSGCRHIEQQSPLAGQQQFQLKEPQSHQIHKEVDRLQAQPSYPTQGQPYQPTQTQVPNSKQRPQPRTKLKEARQAAASLSGPSTQANFSNFVATPSKKPRPLDITYQPMPRPNNKGLGNIVWDHSTAVPLYPEYQGFFHTAEEAKARREKVHGDPKKDPNIEYIRNHGRQFWVRALYNAMIDISHLADRANSVHRNRFTIDQAFEPEDLEACAHEIFDACIVVHTIGWNRNSLYRKSHKRGKYVDKFANDIEGRLDHLCMMLRTRKAVVDDAMRGGLTLALLCDNPLSREGTKESNNNGNAKRGERLRAEKEAREREQARQAQLQAAQQSQFQPQH